MTNKLYFLIMFSAAILLTGCGGSNNDTTINNSSSLDNSTQTQSNLPPDPGSIGMSTLLGVDSDNDGVRDDVQIAISNRYPSDTNSQLALSQLAMGIQDAFTAQSADDSNELNNTFQKIVSATDCITVTTSQPLQDIIFVQSLMANTSTRSEIYEDVNTAASGQFFGGDNDLESACQR